MTVPAATIPAVHDVASLWLNVLRSVGEDCDQTPTEMEPHSLGVDMGHGCSFLLSEHLIGKRVRRGMTDTHSPPSQKWSTQGSALRRWACFG